MLDPNIRPNLINDQEWFRSRMERMMGKCETVEISNEDLDWTFPGCQPAQEKFRSIVALGPSLVLATQGSAGTTAISSTGSEVTVPAVKTRVVDPMGAGDTFDAGVLAGLSRMNKLSRVGLPELSDAELESALSLGSAAPAVTVSRAGANPPWKKELTERTRSGDAATPGTVG